VGDAIEQDTDPIVVADDVGDRRPL